jgi:hypothetical protein
MTMNNTQAIDSQTSEPVTGGLVRCACPACGLALPPVVWRSTTPCYILEVSPARYAKFSDKVKRWYVPVYASPNTEASNARARNQN